MKTVYKLIVGIITIFLLWSVYTYVQDNKMEHLVTSTSNTDASPCANMTCEALQNLSSMYNDKKAIVPNFNITGDLTVTGKFNLLPKGIIVAWQGTKIPNGWALCDGTNGTPNLINRFIYGGTVAESVAKKMGGERVHTLTQSEMPSHLHSTKTCDGGPKMLKGIGCYRSVPASGFSVGISRSSGAVGGGTSHNNMPPYYVLAYIMKL